MILVAKAAATPIAAEKKAKQLENKLIFNKKTISKTISLVTIAKMMIPKITKNKIISPRLSLENKLRSFTSRRSSSTDIFVVEVAVVDVVVGVVVVVVGVIVVLVDIDNVVWSSNLVKSLALKEIFKCLKTSNRINY